MKYIIIGGVAGGATAAARLRRVDEKSDILLFEKGKYISYANCGLPYYIGGVIAEREKLLVQTPASFGQRFRIDVRVENEVIAIHPKDKTITVRTADGREYEETYDKLLLSPGATPVRPPLEGIDSEGIFTLRNVEDTDHIKSYLTENSVKRAVVVGAGFIGLEMAENLHHAGVAVSVVEMGNQVMAPIDFSMAAPIHQHLIQKGVSLYLEEGVTHFQRTKQGITVFLKSGKTIPADMVLLSIGVRPATALAKQAGLKIGEAGGIWVNEYLETSAKDIYAVGDAIEYPHPLTGKPWLNFLDRFALRLDSAVIDRNAGHLLQQPLDVGIGSHLERIGIIAYRIALLRSAECLHLLHYGLDGDSRLPQCDLSQVFGRLSHPKLLFGLFISHESHGQGI